MRKYIRFVSETKIKVFECGNKKDNLTTREYYLPKEDFDNYADKIVEAKSRRLQSFGRVQIEGKPFVPDFKLNKNKR